MKTIGKPEKRRVGGLAGFFDSWVWVFGSKAESSTSTSSCSCPSLPPRRPAAHNIGGNAVTQGSSNCQGLLFGVYRLKGLDDLGDLGIREKPCLNMSGGCVCVCVVCV